MKTIAMVLALAVVYAVTAALGLQLDAVSGFATLVWPPTGIAIAALFLFGRRLWPGVALGAFLINLYTGASPMVAVGIAVGNTLEAVLAATLFRQAGFRAAMDRIHDVFILISLGAVLSTLVSATIGVTSLWLGGTVSTEAFGTTWSAWWVGDMLGALVVAPFLLAWLNRLNGIGFSWKRVLEAVTLVVVLFSLSFLVFGGVVGKNGEAGPFVYLVFLPLIWAALRFGLRGATLATLVLSVLAIWATVNRTSPFIRPTLSESLLYLQVFMGAVATTTLFLAASVAERKRAQEETMMLNAGLMTGTKGLEEQNRKDEAMLKAIGDGVVSVDQRARVMTMNPAAEALLGYRFEELEGKSFTEVVHMLDAQGKPLPPKQRPMATALSTAEVVKTSISPAFYFVRKDGSPFPVAVTAAPIVLDFVRGVVLVFREISREMALDQAKTEFVSLASHQLRNPLTVVRWHSEMLLEDKDKLGPEMTDSLEQVHRGTLLMAELVDGLLNVSRIDAGTYKPVQEDVDLIAAAKSVIAELDHAARKKEVTVFERYEKGLPVVIGDPKFLRIALQNLVSNAVKYTRDGTKVTIDISQGKAGQRKDGRTLKRDGVIIVAVSDEGVGIPSNQWEKIFTKFFRADNVRLSDTEGTGLGLYLTKAIVTRAGGDIWFESEEGKGSTFYLMLPSKGAKA